MKNRLLGLLGLTLLAGLSACTKNILDSAAVRQDPVEGIDLAFSTVSATCTDEGLVVLSAQTPDPEDEERVHAAMYQEHEYLGTWELRSQTQGLYLRSLSAELIEADCRTETLYAAVSHADGGGQTVQVTAE